MSYERHPSCPFMSHNSRPPPIPPPNYDSPAFVIARGGQWMLRLHVYSLASSSFLFWWCLSLHSHLLLLSWRGICVVGLIAALIACHLWPLAGDEPHQRFNSMLLQFRAMTAMFSPASLTAIQGHSELSGMHYCSTPGPLFTRKRLFRLNIWFIFLAHDDHRS